MKNKISRRGFLKNGLAGVISTTIPGIVLAQNTSNTEGGTDLIKRVKALYEIEKPINYDDHSVHLSPDSQIHLKGNLSDGTEIEFLDQQGGVDREVANHYFIGILAKEIDPKGNGKKQQKRSIRIDGLLFKQNNKKNNIVEVRECFGDEHRLYAFNEYSKVNGGMNIELNTDFGSFRNFIPNAKIPSIYKELADLVISDVLKYHNK